MNESAYVFNHLIMCFWVYEIISFEHKVLLREVEFPDAYMNRTHIIDMSEQMG